MKELSIGVYGWKLDDELKHNEYISDINEICHLSSIINIKKAEENI